MKQKNNTLILLLCMFNVYGMYSFRSDRLENKPNNLFITKIKQTKRLPTRLPQDNYSYRPSLVPHPYFSIEELGVMAGQPYYKILQSACTILQVKPDASCNEINQAYVQIMNKLQEKVNDMDHLLYKKRERELQTAYNFFRNKVKRF